MPSSGCQKCALDRKSTRLNFSHGSISYAVFCLKKNQHHAFGEGFVARARLTDPATRTRPPAERGAGAKRGGGSGGPRLIPGMYSLFFLIIRRPPRSPLFPSPPLFR